MKVMEEKRKPGNGASWGGGAMSSSSTSLDSSRTGSRRDDVNSRECPETACLSGQREGAGGAGKNVIPERQEDRSLTGNFEHDCPAFSVYHTHHKRGAPA